MTQAAPWRALMFASGGAAILILTVLLSPHLWPTLLLLSAAVALGDAQNGKAEAWFTSPAALAQYGLIIIAVAGHIATARRESKNRELRTKERQRERDEREAIKRQTDHIEEKLQPIATDSKVAAEVLTDGGKPVTRDELQRVVQEQMQPVVSKIVEDVCGRMLKSAKVFLRDQQ